MNKADHKEAKIDQEKAETFTEIYDIYFTRLFWFAMSFLKNEPDAHDVVTDVFEKLWSNMDLIDSVENLEAYLKKMITNACLDIFKRDKLRASIMKDLSQTMEQHIEATYELAEIKAGVLNFYERDLPKLSSDYKEVFNLSLMRDMENETVAQRLEISNQAVRKIKEKLRKMLRKRMMAPAIYILFCLFISK